MTTEEQVQESEEATRPDEAIATKADAGKVFQFSDFVHIGDGAKECEQAGEAMCQYEEDGRVSNIAEACLNPEHFHAFCRLPNKFQHKDIRDKALAAKSRKARGMRDPKSDLHDVLEGELDELRAAADDILVDEILSQDWAQDYLEAVRDIEEKDEYEGIEQDRERFAELAKEFGDMDEDEWSDEFAELKRHVAEYVDEISKQVDENRKPKREALLAKGKDGLVEMLRGQHIELAADREFTHVYAEWTWFVGTLKVQPDPTFKRPHARYFETRQDMEAESPEVIDLLKETYEALELALQRGSRGNS